MLEHFLWIGILTTGEEVVLASTGIHPDRRMMMMLAAPTLERALSLRDAAILLAENVAGSETPLSAIRLLRFGGPPEVLEEIPSITVQPPETKQ